MRVDYSSFRLLISDLPHGEHGGRLFVQEILSAGNFLGRQYGCLLRFTFKLFSTFSKVSLKKSFRHSLIRFCFFLLAFIPHLHFTLIITCGQCFEEYDAFITLTPEKTSKRINLPILSHNHTRKKKLFSTSCPSVNLTMHILCYSANDGHHIYQWEPYLVLGPNS